MSRLFHSPRGSFAGAAALRDRFYSAWARSDEIFALVKGEAMLSKPIAWRHPFIFYVGHLPAFAWNQICRAALNWKSFNPGFDDLFSRGIDPDIETGDCHSHPDVPASWPDLKAILFYRNQVRSAVLESFDAVFGRRSKTLMTEGGRVFSLVLEHEYMHQETLLYLIQALPFALKVRPNGLPQAPNAGTATLSEIEISSGPARMGTGFDEILFGWDNEFPTLEVGVPAFKIDSLPVTNRRFFEFIRSGGYDQARFWREQDWKWKCASQRKHPNFWTEIAGEWFYLTLFDRLPLAEVEDWPVYVSLAEARAFAKWCGKRLPMEAEFHRAAYDTRGEEEQPSRRQFDKPKGNYDFARWSPVSVGATQSENPWGVRDLIGNGWEWTETPFQPFPGFTPYIDGYPEYSSDFFDGKHFVLKGASWATAADLVRPSFRNWYQAHYPYVFAKFRCVSD